MSYYFSTNLKNISFDEAIDKVKESLKKEGFGVLTEIDVSATMKKKLDQDLPPYMILGACNPPFAYKALQIEDKIGAMLPCNVIVKKANDGIEVAAVDPVASMQAVKNENLVDIANKIQAKLKSVIADL
jgi:uncharacterized protein (DUF302 family)